jgi:hypothetical protein
MGFLDKLLGKGKEDKSTPAKSTSSGTGEIRKVYLYVASTAPLNAATAEQITAFGLQQLKADPTFSQIMDRMEREKWPTVKGRGTVSSPAQFGSAFDQWLKTEGTSLDQATPVMGKKFFVQGGDAQNPADGSKFSWGLVGCFQ